ncbi:type VI secretion system baseplate subunit TssF [Pseudoduganella sp. OTU4001]|uniref:type VI secretion system baseplate subunit TssF n=1 Tax=Pseudoduganella sp. OTU4001 TaxID=3043854 RepID=UPI00313D4390
MDPRLLRYYNQELQHLREMGGEFARQFPKIAGRLGMEDNEVADPYVERLLEGVGFMAARVQLKLDAEFPRFTQRLQQIIYPGYQAPTPSMLIAQFAPQPDETNLAQGLVIPRGSALRSQRNGSDDMAACEFRTAQDVRLWPLELASAEYFSFAPDLPLAKLPVARRIKGGVRLRLKTTAGLSFQMLGLDELRLFLAGSDELAYRLHEQCLGACVGMLVAPAARPWPWYEFLPAARVCPVGYQDGQALLPATVRGFQGYRLLQEYFAFPQRFMFMDLQGLQPAVRRHAGNELEIVLLFERGDAALESVVSAANFALFCAPAINLFPKRADRIHLNDKSHEYHVVADRTHPQDYEVYEVCSVTGHGVGSDSECSFAPLYTAYHDRGQEQAAYFSSQREPRLLSEGQKRTGFRSNYVGSEVFISLVDPQEAPFRNDLRQLSITTLCTNRDLPLHMPLGAGKSDFTLDFAAPVTGVRCVKGPSRPFAPNWDGAQAWRFLSHLALNYLSLLDADAQQGATALRQMLALYVASQDHGLKKQVDAMHSVKVQPVVRRLPGSGPLAFGRGLRVELEVDEMGFQGGSAFLFGSVMAEFFARYVSINSFTETVLRSTSRGQIMHWMPICGTRPTI